MTIKNLTWGPKAMFRFWLVRTVMYIGATPIFTMLIAFPLSKIGLTPPIGGTSVNTLLIDVAPIGAFVIVVIIWLNLKTLRCEHCGSHRALRATDKGIIDGYYTTWPTRCKFCNKSSSVKIKTAGNNSGGGDGG